MFTLSDFMMTGVAVTFTCATAMCVIKPKTWGESQTKCVLNFFCDYFLTIPCSVPSSGAAYT